MSVLFNPTALVVPFENLRMSDVDSVGGKNASLGEMISQLPAGVSVPTGFATTAHAFRLFLQQEHLGQRIEQALKDLDSENISALNATGTAIRSWIMNQAFPQALELEIRQAFETLNVGAKTASYAVRSSATAEDFTKSRKFLRRCTTTGPSVIVFTKDSFTQKWRCLQVYKKWSAQTWRLQACCLP
jgi:pyruvate, water dikinase